MAPQAIRKSISFAPTRRSQSNRLRCERFEDRVNPVLFTPQAAMPFTGLNNNGCVAVADFNKDGLDDAVLTNYGTGSQVADGTTITLLRGRPDGMFDRLALPTGGSNVSFASFTDINGDTWPDLVVSNGNQEGIGSISVFRNNGAGSLSLFGTPIPAGGNGTAWVGTADMTGDGILDIVVGNFGKKISSEIAQGNNITIFQGNADGQGHGNFTFSNGPITTLAPPTSGVNAMLPTALALADFDGDNNIDIAAATPGIPPGFGLPYGPGSIYLFKGLGSGAFTVTNVYDTGGDLPVNIQAADLDADGKKDLIIANAGDPTTTPDFQSDSVGYLINASTQGNPSFGFTTGLTANTYGPFAVAIEDFNLDGKADIAAVNYGSQFGSPAAFVSIFLGNGLGAFNADVPGSYDTMTGVSGGQYLAVGDFDNDNVPDLIVAHAHSSNRVGLLINNSGGTTAPTVTATQVNDGTAQRSRVTSLTVTFNSPVTFAGPVANAFTLTRTGGGAVSFTATANVVGGVTVVTLNGFTGTEADTGSLRDGRYTLTALANQISAGGQQMASNYTFGDSQGLFRFYGDMNADRRVDISDFGFFSLAYLTPANYNAALDFNNDGRIDIADFGQFSVRYFTTLP